MIRRLSSVLRCERGTLVSKQKTVRVPLTTDPYYIIPSRIIVAIDASLIKGECRDDRGGRIESEIAAALA